MFCFFRNDLFENFWSNQHGDVFCENTLKSMKWEKSLVDLVYYPLLDNVPEFYEFDSSKNLIIKKEVVTISERQSVDDFGDVAVLTEEIKTYEIDKIIEPVVYCAKGLMLKPC
jgi:hypothetical protein